MKAARTFKSVKKTIEKLHLFSIYYLFKAMHARLFAELKKEMAMT